MAIRQKIERPAFDVPRNNILTNSGSVEEGEKIKKKIDKILEKNKKELRKMARRKKRHHIQESGE